MKHFLLRLGKHALLLAVMLSFCSGAWAEVKVVYYTPSGEFLSNDVSYPAGEDHKSCVGYSIDDQTGIVSQISFCWGTPGFDNTFATVTIPDEIEGTKVTEIASYSSPWCQGLKKIVFPKHLKGIGRRMIAYDKIDSGDNYRHYGIETLATLDFSKVENFADLTIADDAFEGCTALLTGDDGKFIYSGYDTEFDHGAQTGVTYTICPKTHAMSITDFTAYTTVLRIDGSRKVNNEIQGTDCRLNGMLKNLEIVKEIIISEGLTTLGDNEFEGCTKLELLVLPKSCDFNNFASADDNARCGASIFKGFAPKWVLAFSSGVPYRFKMINETSATATVDYSYGSLGNYDAVKGEYNRTPQAEGDIKFYPTIEFAKGYKATFTSIPDNAFAGNAKITSVLIGGTEDDVCQIGSIGVNAFKGCTGMTEFTLTNNHTDGMAYGASCFEGCTGLTKLDLRARDILADNTTGMQLPAGFLKGCTNISRLSFGNDIDESKIADDALPSITGNLNTVDFVKTKNTSVANYTWFRDRECQLNGGVKLNGEATYESESGPHVALLGLAYADNGSRIQTQAQLNDEVFFCKEGGIGGKLQTICDRSFTCDSHITEITLPASVVRVGSKCFDTDVLEKLTINRPEECFYLSRPDGATSSEEMVAWYYASGKDAPEEWTITTAHSISNVKYFFTALYNNFGQEAKAVKHFSIVYDKLPTTFTQTMIIGAAAFKDCTTLKRIDLGTYVTAIGESTFRGCTGLTSLVVDWKNLQAVDDGAFGGCTGIKAFVYDFNKIKTKAKDDAYDKIIRNVYDEKKPANVYIVYSGETFPSAAFNVPVDKTHASDYRYLPTKSSYGSQDELVSGYGTICVPYDIDRRRSYNLKSVYEAKLNADGTSLTLKGGDTAGAGVPCVFKRLDKGYEDYDESNLVVFASGENYKYVSEPVNSDDNILTGTFTATKAEDGDYVMQSDNNFHVVNTATYQPTVGAFRSYIKASSLTAATVQPAALLSLMIGGSTTAIDGINASGNADAADKKIYTIDGQRVQAPVKGRVYIIGGKKRVY